MPENESHSSSTRSDAREALSGKTAEERAALQQREEIGAEKEGRRRMPSIQTYEYDAHEAVHSGDESLYTISRAQQKQGAARQRSNTSSGNGIWRAVMIYGGIVILIGGIAAAGVYGYSFFATEPQEGAGQQRSYQQLISTQAQHQLVIGPEMTRDGALEVMEQAREEVSEEGGEVVVFPILETEGAQKQIAPERLMELIGPNAPGLLTRSLNDEYVYGMLTDTSAPFLILTTESFERALPGMLEWEAVMAQDLEHIFQPATANVQGATVQLDGQEARELRTADGRVLGAYMFLQKNTIAIAPSSEQLERLSELFYAEGHAETDE